MITGNNNKYGSTLSFIDMLFNILCGIAVLFLLSLLLINKPTQHKKIDPKTELMLILTWPDKSIHDVDLWLLSPERDKIGYNNKSNSYCFLERDDLGISNDFTINQYGKKVPIESNQEIISIRAKQPGKYVVNVVLFMRHFDDTHPDNKKPIPVKVELVQINPTYKVVYASTDVLLNSGDEKTMFSFKIVDAEITDIARKQEFFVYKGSGDLLQ